MVNRDREEFSSTDSGTHSTSLGYYGFAPNGEQYASSTRNYVWRKAGLLKVNDVIRLYEGVNLRITGVTRLTPTHVRVVGVTSVVGKSFTRTEILPAKRMIKTLFLPE